MTIGDLNPNADPRIAGVNIRPGDSAKIAILESNDIFALTVAVATAISNGRTEFVSGTHTTATLRRTSTETAEPTAHEELSTLVSTPFQPADPH